MVLLRRFCLNVRTLRMPLNPRNHRCRYTLHSWSLVSSTAQPLSVPRYCPLPRYPVPVLTAIGELDGGGLSYLRREAAETAALPAEVTEVTKTIYVPQVCVRSWREWI